MKLIEFLNKFALIGGIFIRLAIFHTDDTARSSDFLSPHKLCDVHLNSVGKFVIFKLSFLAAVLAAAFSFSLFQISTRTLHAL